MTSWNEIIRQHGPPTYRAAWRILQHAQDCEDVLQDVFIEAHKIFESDGITHPRTCGHLAGVRRPGSSAEPGGNVTSRIKLRVCGWQQVR